MILKMEDMAKMKSSKVNFDALVENIKLDRPKASKYIVHIYADFIELIALFSKEETTLSDISDLLNDVKDSNIVELDDESLELSKSETNDKIEEKIINIFNLSAQRSFLYTNEEYPFDVSVNNIKLKNNLTEKHKLYLVLLISSNLNYFESIYHLLTKEFELLSLHSLKSFLTPKAVVKSFGKNTEYTGNTIKKINDLANELGIKINKDNVEYISKNNVQERGCDLISWLPFEDKIPNMIIFICQCACGKDWESKQAETVLFSNYFYFHLTPIHSMFVPYSLSNPNKKFDQNDRIANNLFFDRKRILEQFDKTNFMKIFESIKIVEEFIKTRISIN